MATTYLHPYHNQHGIRDDGRHMGSYPNDLTHHHHHRHHDESLPRSRPTSRHSRSSSRHSRTSSRHSRTSSDNEDLSRRHSDDSDVDAPIRRSRSVVRHVPDQPRSRDHSHASSSGRHNLLRPHSENPATTRRKEHAAEKAIGAASAAAFHVRSAEGSWVGAKGLKVVGAASAAALIDYTLNKDPKHHKARSVAVSMFQGGVIEQILKVGDKHDDDVHPKERSRSRHSHHHPGHSHSHSRHQSRHREERD